MHKSIIIKQTRAQYFKRYVTKFVKYEMTEKVGEHDRRQNAKKEPKHQTREVLTFNSQ